MKIVACGISGLIGSHLARALQSKYSLVRLRRNAAPGGPMASTDKEILWNPPFTGDWVNAIDGAYAVVNLSGEPLAGKRWTADQKRILRDSRLKTTRAIVDAISQVKSKPAVLVNASAIGYYGPRDDARLNEDAAPGSGFLGELCREWEAEALKAESYGVRTVLLRTGIVLAKEGGALKKMAPPFRMFAGGPLGTGRQIMSWVHIEDEVGAILKVLEDARLRGPVNVTSPQAVSMNDFAALLGQTLKRPSVFRVPGFVLRLLLGEMAEMLLTGQNVYPKKLSEAGFQFRFSTLEKALKDLLL